ncbi:hypothetical protein CLIM01_12529 [Colletotrichum limetticola]|uniref:Cytochrome P450 n=1 Tax=Colletotrichum limetticola TaxID=1209924 RepID=A0ABQ9PDL0_9PEZI|nr:hypothetical protein CLIM01_12529 [Colletotrichum limetticola]
MTIRLGAIQRRFHSETVDIIVYLNLKSADTDIVPSQTEVGVANMAMHRNPKYFERPNDFIPERWIGDGQSAVKDKSAFSPFSKGPRACLGRTMAYMEMSLALAAMFLEMDMEFEDPGSEAKQGYTATDSFVLVRPKVRIVVKSRR